MLRDNDAVATLAVKDLDVAAKFYQDTLGSIELTKKKLRRSPSRAATPLSMSIGQTSRARTKRQP